MTGEPLLPPFTLAVIIKKSNLDIYDPVSATT